MSDELCMIPLRAPVYSFLSLKNEKDRFPRLGAFTTGFREANNELTVL